MALLQGQTDALADTKVLRDETKYYIPFCLFSSSTNIFRWQALNVLMNDQNCAFKSSIPFPPPSLVQFIENYFWHFRFTLRLWLRERSRCWSPNRRLSVFLLKYLCYSILFLFFQLVKMLMVVVTVYTLCYFPLNIVWVSPEYWTGKIFGKLHRDIFHFPSSYSRLQGFSQRVVRRATGRRIF